MNPDINTQQLLVENNPIEAVIKILTQFAHVFDIEDNNAEGVLRARVVNDMFLNIVNTLPPEEQIATLEYISEGDEDRRELIILDQGARVSQLIKYIALNSKKFLIGENIDHYLVYQMVHDFADEYETVFNQLNIA
jgi:hypothetical protein